MKQCGRRCEGVVECRAWVRRWVGGVRGRCRRCIHSHHAAGQSGSRGAPACRSAESATRPAWPSSYACKHACSVDMSIQASRPFPNAHGGVHACNTWWRPCRLFGQATHAAWMHACMHTHPAHRRGAACAPAAQSFMCPGPGARHGRASAFAAHRCGGRIRGSPGRRGSS